MRRTKTCLECEWHVHMDDPTVTDPTGSMIEHAVATGHDLETVEETERP